MLRSELIQAAAAPLIAAHPENASLHRAIDRASDRLLTHRWDVDAGILRIASDSRPGVYHFVDEGNGCDCEARTGVCWHIAAWKLLSVLAAADVDVTSSEAAGVQNEQVPASTLMRPTPAPPPTHTPPEIVWLPEDFARMTDAINAELF